MRIKWYGTASLLIEGGNTRILVDPYLKAYNPRLPRLPVEEAAGADAAVITHPHLDHFSDIGAFLEAGLKRVYVSRNGIERAAAQGIPTDRMSELSAGDEFVIGGITVRSYQSRHCKFDAGTVLAVALNPMTYLRGFKAGVALLKSAKKFRIGKDIYALEFVHGGKSVTVLGSAGMDPDTVYPQGSDLLVFAYQGRTGMYRYMRRFLDVFRPKAVMASHFDNAFPPLTHAVDMKKFVPAVEKKLPEARAWVPREGEWYEV